MYRFTIWHSGQSGRFNFTNEGKIDKDSIIIDHDGYGNYLGGSIHSYLDIPVHLNEDDEWAYYLQDICGKYDGNNCDSSCSSICQNRGQTVFIKNIKWEEEV